MPIFKPDKYGAEFNETTHQNMAAGYICNYFHDNSDSFILHIYVAEQGANSGTKQSVCGGLCQTDGRPHSMSQEFVKHIFESFERESTATRSGIQDAGLGMPITKNIVDMMGGEITVESEVGKGSTFTIKIPLQLQDIEKTEEHIKELEGLRSLVVDYDFHVCDSVSKMLKNIGLRSEWTTSGREAVYRAKSAYEEGDLYHTYIIDW